MQKKGLIKWLSIMMFAAFIAMAGSAHILYATEEGDSSIVVDGENTENNDETVQNPSEDEEIEENTPVNSKYSTVEKNGVIVSSDNDVFYTSLNGKLTETFKVRIGSVDSSNILFTNVYYYSQTNQFKSIVRSTTGEASAEFDLVLYTNKAEYDLKLYYTTTTATDEQFITLTFFRDNNTPSISAFTLNEEKSVSYNNYYKEVTLDTVVSESGIVNSGIATVDHYLVVNGVKGEVTTESFKTNEMSFTFSDETADNIKLCVVATTKVGNSVELCSELYTFDNVGPVITLTADEKAEEVLKTHTVKVVVTDEKTSVKSVGYKWLKQDSKKTMDELNALFANEDLSTLDYKETASEEFLYTPAATNTQSSYYVLVVRAEDNLGNVSYSWSSQLEVLSTATPYLIGVTENLEEATSSHSAYFSVNESNVDSLESVIYAWAKEAMGYPATYEELKTAIDSNTYEVAGEIQLTGDNKYVLTAQGLDGKYILLVGIKTVDNSMVISSIECGVPAFVFDNTKPTVMVDPDGNVETARNNYDVNVTINEENFSTEVYYLLLDKELETITSTEIKEQGTLMTIDSRMFTIALGKEEALNGTYYLYILVSDAAGNEVITSKAFLFDNLAPTVSVVVEDRYYSNSELIEVLAVDEAKIVSYEYAWVKVAEGIDTSKLVLVAAENNLIPASSVLADGSYYLFVKVTDEAGNVSELYQSAEIKFDVTAPVVNGIEDNGYYTNLVKVEVEDSNSVTLTLNGKEVENGSEIATTGFYTLVVTDALNNKTIVNFVVNVEGKATISNKEVSVLKQQYAPIQCEEGVCFIEVAKDSYQKDSSIVLTTLKDGKYQMLNQDTSYVTVTKDLKETLSIRKYRLEVSDKAVISEEADENGYYGYVNVHNISMKNAVKLGIEETVIDNEAVTLSLGLAGSFALIGIYFVSKSKKNRI